MQLQEYEKKVGRHNPYRHQGDVTCLLSFH